PANAHCEALTADAETEEHLLESIMSIFAVPISRPRRDRPCAGAGFLLIGSIQGDRRRILIEPWGREGIDLQGVEGDRPKHAVEMRGKQRLENLPQPVIMERGALEAGLGQGQHPALLQTCPHIIESMMAIENRQEQGLYSTATREHMSRVRRAEGIDEGSHIELADHPQYQRQVGHGTDLLNRNRHKAPLLQAFSRGVIIADVTVTT